MILCQFSRSVIYDKNEFEEKIEKMSPDSDPFIVSNIINSNQWELGKDYRVEWQNVTTCQWQINKSYICKK